MGNGFFEAAKKAPCTDRQVQALIAMRAMFMSNSFWV